MKALGILIKISSEHHFFKAYLPFDKMIYLISKIYQINKNN